MTFGANPALQPEHGEAQTLGVVWKPSFVPELMISLSDWQVEIVDNISLPGGPDFFLTNEELFPGFITRGPGSPGPVTHINWSYINFGSVQVAGTDIDLTYAFEGPWGRWSLGASATHTREYEVAITPGSPTEDRLSKLFTEAWAPEWKGLVSAGLDTGPWSFELRGRYLGPYEDAGTSTRELGDIWYVDLSTSVDLKRFLSIENDMVTGATLSAVLVNATDELPEFANNFQNHDFTQGGWRGRYLSLRLSLMR